MDFRGAELDLVFLVTNPNSVGLDLTRASYDLEVEGHKVAAGTPKNGLKIPGGATTEVTFPANVQWNEIAPALEALFAMDQLHYKASGELGVGAVTLPLSHEGTFAAPKMPSIDVGSPQITSLTLTGARLALPLKIANLNAFPLPLGGILGTVDIGGSTVGRIAMPEASPVPSNGETTVTVPLNVSFLQLDGCTALRHWPESAQVVHGWVRARACSELESLPSKLGPLASLDLRDCRRIAAAHPRHWARR